MPKQTKTETAPARQQRAAFDASLMKILARAIVAKDEKTGLWGQVAGVKPTTPVEPGQRRIEVHVYQYADNAPKAKVVIVGTSAKGENYQRNVESFDLSLAVLVGKLADKAMGLLASKGAQTKAKRTAAA
jgi:hypothetical protein